MENASEALILSSALFIAIILAGLLIFSYRNATGLQRQDSQMQDVEQLAKWNAEWEAYNKKILYGADVINVINKTEQNDMGDYKIEINVLDKDFNEIEKSQIKKYSIYECMAFKYSDVTGRVELITYHLVE